jgi:hypothetical protein
MPGVAPAVVAVYPLKASFPEAIVTAKAVIHAKTVIPQKAVIPAKAGIHSAPDITAEGEPLDCPLRPFLRGCSSSVLRAPRLSRFRGNPF